MRHIYTKNLFIINVNLKFSWTYVYMDFPYWTESREGGDWWDCIRMTTHSSILAWKIPWTEEPGRLQAMGSQRVRHDWETSLSFFFLGKHKMTGLKSLFPLHDWHLEFLISSYSFYKQMNKHDSLFFFFYLPFLNLLKVKWWCPKHNLDCSFSFSRSNLQWILMVARWRNGPTYGLRPAAGSG